LVNTHIGNLHLCRRVDYMHQQHLPKKKKRNQLFIFYNCLSRKDTLQTPSVLTDPYVKYVKNRWWREYVLSAINVWTPTCEHKNQAH